MRHRNSLRGLASFALLGLAACGQVDLAPEVDDFDTQNETVYPPAPAPLLPADQVNWRAAAQPTHGEDPRSDFMRAQSLMSKLAAAAYQEQGEFDAQVNPLGLRGSKVSAKGGFFNAARPEAYVGTSERYSMTFVAIRGTSAFADYLVDFYNAPVVTDGPNKGTLHRGFANYADAIYDEVKGQLGFSCHPGLAPEQKVPLWLTGHSLGAAAASIVAYRLQQDGCNVAGVALFASPRPGLSDFRANYMGSLPNMTQRWTTSRDPIYCLPPGGAWKHVGTENKIDGGLHIGTGDDESHCNSPSNTIGAIKTSLIALGPLTYGTAWVSQALLDWLAGKFDLGIICDNDAKWDDVVTLGLCRVTDYGYGISSIYNITPQDLLTSAISLAMIKYHDVNRYVLEAQFNDPPPSAEWVKVRVLIARASHPRPSAIVETVYQGVCEPAVLDDNYYFCDFDAPVGGVIRLTSEATYGGAALTTLCDRYKSDDFTPLDCEMTVNGPVQVSVSAQFYL